MVKLRPYQSEFVKKLGLVMQKDKRVIACMATGGGKTKTFVYIAKQTINAGLTVLILTESKKIFEQIAKEGLEEHWINATKKDNMYIRPNCVYLAMAQTLISRPKILQQLAMLGNKLLIICDEAHIGSTAAPLIALPNAYLLGFTATPAYDWANHLPTVYKNIVVGPQPQELVECGSLAPYFHFQRINENIGSLKKVNGEYTEKSQMEVFNGKLFDGLIDDIKKVTFKKALVFCASINHANETFERLKQNGVKVCVNHTKNPTNDIDLVGFTTTNKYNVCCTVGQLTKGFDCPVIDAVFLYRKTTSLPLYLQMIGRGSRTHPEKTKFTVYDYGLNGDFHGAWNIDRDWEKMWLPLEKGKERPKIAPSKCCPSCELLVFVSVAKCPECGYEFAEAKKDEEIDLLTGELKSLTTEYDNIRGKYIDDLTPAELWVYALQTNKKTFAQRVARTKGRDFLTDYATIAGYKLTSIDYQLQLALIPQNVGFNNFKIV
jgi:superfamily II DNA or RNA helicase